MEKNDKEKIIVDKNAKRLDVFVAEYLKGTGHNNFSRSKIRKMIEKGNLTLNNKTPHASSALKIGDIIEFSDFNEETTIKPQDIKLDIKYEDDDLLIINKPKNMLTHPTPLNLENTLVNALLAHCGENLSDIGGNLRRGIVHRLDKNTAGLMLAAKNNEAHKILSTQIRKKTAVRKYLAIVYGNIEKDEGTINKPLSHVLKNSVKMKIAGDNDKAKKSAVTHFKVIKRYDNATVVELILETGRTHQIRAHLASINHPIINDTMYGSKGRQHKLLKNIKTSEQILQSYYLCFTHPKTGVKMEFELQKEDFDKDFIKVTEILERSKNG